MKAIITKEYGDVEVLGLEEIDIPTISNTEILVHVKAVSINPLDYKVRNGELKMMTGKVPPRIIGSDFSGVISKVGNLIDKYKVGDEVFGLLNGMKNKEGSYAEYVKVEAININQKPINVSFEEATSFPMVASTAYNALVKVGNITKGSDILIHGSTGGVGSASLEVAKSIGANVSAVASSNNIAYAKELGATTVIDYKKEDVTKSSEKFDVIFDAAGVFSYDQAKGLLKPNGTYVTTNATMSAIMLSPIANLFRSKKFKIVMTQPNADTLGEIKILVEKGALKAHIHKIFTLETIKEAHSLSQKGGFRGKLIVDVK